MPQSGTSYYRIDARDTAGKKQEMYAAYRNEEFVLFMLDGHTAQVMFLLPAKSAAELPAEIRKHVIDVDDAKLLPARPTIDRAELGAGRQWTEMEKGKIGVILETRELH